MVSLKNTEKRYQVFNLPCPVKPCDGSCGKCELITQRFPEELDDGKVGIRETEKRIPGSMTLLAGETAKGLPDWVASCPEVKAALDRGALKLIQE